MPNENMFLYIDTHNYKQIVLFNFPFNDGKWLMTTSIKQGDSIIMNCLANSGFHSKKNTDFTVFYWKLFTYYTLI